MVAASLEALAAWVDGELAAGQPPKWVAQHASAAARHIAADARTIQEDDTMTFKTTAYKALKHSDDVNAIKRGKVPRRIVRRLYGRASSRLARKLPG
jgi:hypothetical protein